MSDETFLSRYTARRRIGDGALEVDLTEDQEDDVKPLPRVKSESSANNAGSTQVNFEDGLVVIDLTDD